MDDVQRRLADIEKRLARLEKLTERPAYKVAWQELHNRTPATMVKQFCDCGKDRLLCRAPDCPTHKRSGA